VREPALGDEVTSVAMTGAFCERIAVDARQVQRKPPQLSHEEAAAYGVTYRTAFTAVRTVAEAKPGEWVAVLGAAGGVGSACLDVAKRLGCRTLAVVSNEEKARACLDWGADAALCTRDADVKARIRELTGEGADVVLDPVGGALAEPALRALRWRGRFVVLGFASGEIPRIPLNLVLLKNVQIRGLDIRGIGEREPERLAQGRAELDALVAQGLRPHIGARFPLAETGAAMRVVADRRALGKVVIVPGR
jgi:NADPH2:quinone reductase